MFHNIMHKLACERAYWRPSAFNSSTGIGPASSSRVRSCGRWRLLLSGLTLAPLVSLASAEVSLTREEAARIGHKIWQNESGGSLSGLTAWNQGEDFASLGIGHFIWYPAGRPGPFEESFPPMVEFIRTRGPTLPP